MAEATQEKGPNADIQSSSTPSRDTSQIDEHLHATKTHHTDGTISYVDNHAVGGDLEDMPKGYYRSWQFIMTVTVRNAASIPLTTTDNLEGRLSRQQLCVSRVGVACKHSVSNPSSHRTGCRY
jgi:hypothetical protein